VRLIPFFIWGL
jgi:GNAT superfamily N-acetyltransferase